MRSPLPARFRQVAIWFAVLALTVAVGSRVGVAPAPAARTHQMAPAAAVHRVLFDNTKAETAGNADWVISTSQPDPLQQNPAPQSETDWTGAISSWGVALQKTGQYSLKTLPSGNTITYGTAGALDLSQFDTFVLPEPNIRLSTAEKTAVMRFVQNGGGLFLISDHNGSDRNNDGWDSPKIINDLLTSNGVDNTDPFGFSVDSLNITTDNPVAIHDSSNPIINGPFGTVTGSILRNGTTMTLHPGDDPNVRGLVWQSTANQSGTTGAFVVTSTFGNGRVAIWGDSSTIDDGTGASGNTLFDGWNDPAGTDAAIGLNTTAWLAGSGGGAGGVTVTNPGSQTGAVGTAAHLQISAIDTAGGTLSYGATGLPSGLSVSSSTGLISGTPTTAGTSQVTVTATDSTGPSGSTSFAWTISGSGGGGSQLLGNPGFETGTAAPWTGTSKVIYSGSKEPARSGSWDAWLDGYGTTTTDTLSQQVTIPSTARSATLSYWLHVDTAETTTTTAYDTLKAQLLNGSGTVLATLATYSNLDHVSGYVQHSFDLSGYAGQTVTLKFTGAEGTQKQTSFVLDDTALTTS